MRKILIPTALLCLYSLTCESKCPWNVQITVYNDGFQVMQFDKNDPCPYAVQISPGDSVKFFAHGDIDCTNHMLMIHNGDTLFNAGLGNSTYNFIAFDTGHYHMNYFFNAFYHIFDTYVTYYTLNEIQNPLSKPLLIYPASQSGIFKIESPYNLKQLLITDASGRMIIKTKQFSEINLCRFSQGIYFYAIIDEKENVWRGKIVKQ